MKSRPRKTRINEKGKNNVTDVGTKGVHGNNDKVAEEGGEPQVESQRDSRGYAESTGLLMTRCDKYGCKRGSRLDRGLRFD